MTTQATGDALLSVRLAWTTAISDELTADIASYRQRLISVQKGLADDQAVVLPVVPGEHDSRLAILVIRPGKEDCHWSFFLAEPPEEVQEGDEDEQDDEDGDPQNMVPLTSAAKAIGGKDAVVALVTKHWTSAPTVNHNVHFHLSTKKWACRTLPTTVIQGSEDEPALSIGAKATVDEIGYQFVDGANGVSRVSIALREESETFHVDALARGLLKLYDSRWVPFAEEVKALILSALFKETKSDG